MAIYRIIQLSNNVLIEDVWKCICHPTDLYHLLRNTKVVVNGKLIGYVISIPVTEPVNFRRGCVYFATEFRRNFLDSKQLWKWNAAFQSLVFFCEIKAVKYLQLLSSLHGSFTCSVRKNQGFKKIIWVRSVMAANFCHVDISFSRLVPVQRM